jgi:hypothetical protein
MTAREDIDAANAKMNGDGPRLEIVSLDSIYMDKYQRPLNEAWLKKREGEFSLSMLGTVTLSKRTKGQKGYAAMDGQHRIELARRHGQTEIAAVVHYDLNKQQEAELFSRFQRERRNITPYQRWNADLEADDTRAKAIKRIVEDEGFTVAEQEGAGSLKAVVSLERIYDDDPALLRHVLRLMRETWGDLPGAQNEGLLKGTAQFLKTNPDVEDSRFIERLRDVTPTTLRGRADNLREARGVRGALPRFIAEAIEDAYRSRQRRK